MPRVIDRALETEYGKKVDVITRQEYNETIERYGDMVTRVLLLRCRDLMDAEDCFQNVFMKLLSVKKSFTDQEHIKAWLLRAAMNEAASCNRRAWRKKVTLIGDSIVPGTEEAQSDTVFLLDALRSLPDELRDVLYLHHYEGYSVTETAAILKIPVGTVKTRLSRARIALRKLLEEEP